MIKGLTEWMKEYWSTMNRLCWKNKYFWIFEALLMIICYLPLGIYYLVEWIKSHKKEVHKCENSSKD